MADVSNVQSAAGPKPSTCASLDMNVGSSVAGRGDDVFVRPLVFGPDRDRI